MQYMGGKARIARRVVRAIVDDGAPTDRWFEPFVGGGNVMEHAAPVFGKCFGTDAHLDLIMMWRAVRDGWRPGDVTRELYAELRNSEPSALRGFVGFGASFGGKWFGGYGYSPRDGDLWKVSARTVARQASVFQAYDVRFGQSLFGDYTPPAGTTVYCDPPYANTTGYSTGGFDHRSFYRTLSEWTRNGVRVYVSEYTTPVEVPFEVIWSHEKKMPLSKGSNDRVASEKLFRIQPN